jgi:hypothetical protein
MDGMQTQGEASNWTDLRRMADELELQIHLGSMEARDRWRALQPRIAEVQRAIEISGNRLDELVSAKIAKLGVALRKLRTQLEQKQ